MNSQEVISNSKVKHPQHGFRMVYCYSRCFGLWPFSFAYHSNRIIMEALVTEFDWLWFSISLCLYLAALFCVYKSIASFSRADHFFWFLVIFLSEVPCILFGAVGIVLHMLNRNCLVNILKNFIIFDRRVSFKQISII